MMNNFVQCFVDYVYSKFSPWELVDKWYYFGQGYDTREEVLQNIVEEFEQKELPSNIMQEIQARLADFPAKPDRISTFKIGDLFFVRFYGGEDYNDSMPSFDFKFQVGFSGILPKIKQHFGIDPRALPDTEDNIDDKQLLTNYIDFNNRTYAAVYIGNGQFIVGDSRDTHTQMLNKYLKDSQLSQTWGRTDINEVQEKCNVPAVAFCHVINDCLFIDTDAKMLNCTLDEVVRAAKSQYSKVYEYKPNSYTTIRKAKRLQTTETMLLQRLFSRHIYIRQL